MNSLEYNLDNIELQELSEKELQDTEGGIVILPVLVGIGLCAGALAAGVLVGYAAYKVADWALN